MILVCQICNNPIAKVKEVNLPIQGSMFDALDAHLPNPFNIMTIWEHLKCPYCHFRPFILENFILTDSGFIEVFKPGKNKTFGSPVRSVSAVEPAAVVSSGPAVGQEPVPAPVKPSVAKKPKKSV